LKPVQSKETLVARLIAECDRQAEEPPIVNGERDEYVGMFAVAVKSAIQDFPEAQKQLAHTADTKRVAGPFPPSYLFNSLLRHSQRAFMFDPKNSNKYDPAYPYASQEQWNERVRALMGDEKEFSKLATNMIFWNVGSDVETRISGPKLVAHVMQEDRVSDANDPFKILNVGSARDHSLAMLSGNIAIPEVGIADGRTLGKEKQRFLQGRVNELLAREIVLGDSYGVDMWPFRDEEWGYFLEACRYYPSELRDPEKRRRYKELEAIRDADPRLHHADADYGKLEFDAPAGSFSLPIGLETEDSYDMVVFSTSLYQSYREKQRQMFDNALRHVKFGGKIVVQDFCKIEELKNPEHPIDRLEFVGPTSKPYLYGTFVYDTLQPKLGLQPFVYWNNGRCETLRPADLLLKSMK
jgi:hypothetical protein